MASFAGEQWRRQESQRGPRPKRSRQNCASRNLYGSSCSSLSSLWRRGRLDRYRYYEWSACPDQASMEHLNHVETPEPGQNDSQNLPRFLRPSGVELVCPIQVCRRRYAWRASPRSTIIGAADRPKQRRRTTRSQYRGQPLATRCPLAKMGRGHGSTWATINIGLIFLRS